MQQNYVEKFKENRLKAFMTTIPDLWKIFKGVLWSKKENIHRATGKINCTPITVR